MNRVLTVPNLITAARLGLIPFFVAAFLRGNSLVGAVLLGVVGATDWIDGFVARRTGQVSQLGKILDPLADRIAIAAGLLTLAYIGIVPWAIAAVLVGRDAAVGLGFLFLAGRKLPILPVNAAGKAATAAIYSGIGALAAGNWLAEESLWDAGLIEALEALGLGLLVVGAAAYALSTAGYIKSLRRGREAKA